MAGAQGFGLHADEAAEDAMRGHALSVVLRAQARITRSLALPSRTSRVPLVASGVSIRNHELVGVSDAAERALLSCEITDGPPTGRLHLPVYSESYQGRCATDFLEPRAISSLAELQRSVVETCMAHRADGQIRAREATKHVSSKNLAGLANAGWSVFTECEAYCIGMTEARGVSWTPVSLGDQPVWGDETEARAAYGAALAARDLDALVAVAPGLSHQAYEQLAADPEKFWNALVRDVEKDRPRWGEFRGRSLPVWE